MTAAFAFASLSDSNAKAAVKPVSVNDVKPFSESSFADSSHLHSFCFCQEERCPDISKTEHDRIKTRDRFQHHWILEKKLSYCKKTGFNWLVFEEGKGMFCILCRKHNTHNPQNKTKKFNTDASVRYKWKAVEEHASTDQHFAAVEAELMNRVLTFQKQIDRREQVKDEQYYNVFLSMYWIAKEELPNCKFVRLIELLRLLKLPNIQYFNHNSAGSAREMFLILGEIVREQVLRKVGKTIFFSILCDEACDVSNKEQLISFVQYVDYDSGKADVKFLVVDNVLKEFQSANADAILGILTKQIEEAGLDKKRLAGPATDGSSVMTGKRNGLAVRLRKDCKLLLNVHCICRRLALACGDANDQVSYIKTIEKVLLQLWAFFKNSSKQSASCDKAAVAAKSLVIWNKKSKKIVAKKLKKACRTRWLSTELAIKGVFENFVPLTQTLRVYKETESDSTAIGLLQQTGNIKFLSAVYLLHEALPALPHLSKAFQRGNVSFSAIQPAINYTLDQLTEIADERKPLRRLREDLCEGGRLAGTKISLTPASESYLENLTVRYVDSLKDNTKNRLSDSLPVLSAFRIFNPTAVPHRSEKSFKDYGVAEKFLSGP